MGWAQHGKSSVPRGPCACVPEKHAADLCDLRFSSLHSYRKQGTAITLGRVQAVWGGLGWVSWLTGLSVVQAAFCN